MRTLKFNVIDNTIKRDPESDFSKLSKEKDVQLVFSFSEDWDGFVKVVEFTRSSTEFKPKVLQHGSTCEVPIEALRGATFFRISVIGKKGSQRKSTKRVIINMNE